MKTLDCSSIPQNPSRRRRVLHGNASTFSRRAAWRFLPLVVGLVLAAGAVPAQEQVLSFGPAGAAKAERGRPTRLLTTEKSRADFESSASVCVARSARKHGADYTALELPGGSLGGEVGEPQLPYYGQFIQVPEEATVRLVIDSVEWAPLAGRFEVGPRQAAPPDVRGAPPSVFTKKAEVYGKDEFLPAEPVRLADRARVRGREMIYVVYTPVVFNPAQKTLKAARQVKWHLEYDVPAAKSLKTKRADPVGDQSFAPLLDGALDARPAEATPESTAAPKLMTGNGADYLIITHDDFFNAILPLANWKHAKGYRTRVVRTSDITDGDTAAGITTYIKNAYDNWNPSPTFVLLVGDSAFIPPHYKTVHSYHGTKSATDLYYAAVDGTDIFPDIFVGRLPCSSVTQCSNMVTKTLTVEKTPNTTASFYTTALTAAYFQDLTDSDPTDSYEGRVFTETCEGVRAYLGWLGYSVATSYVTETATTPRHYNRDTDWWGSILHTNGATYVNAPSYLSAAAATTAVSSNVNRGVWIVQHRDHGSTTGWGDPPFNTGNVNALANADRLPIVMSINCLTANFDSASDSFCEAWLKKSTGGSHCTIGATRVSSSWYNDWMVHGFYECLYANYLETLATFAGYKSTLSYGDNYVGKGTHIGQILDYGKRVMYDKLSGGSQTGTTREQFEIMELFGDPEHSPRNAYPSLLTVTRPSRLTATIATNFNITVTTGGTPLSGALVALVLDPRDYHTAVSDAAGVAHFSFTPQTPIPGSNQMSVVVSHQNRTPYQSTITVDTLGMVVSLPASAREGDGTLAGAGRVSIPAPRASSLGVSLTSGDTTELTVPVSVTILAGSTNATFNITVVDDALLDGTQPAQIRATATGYGDAFDTINVLDNDAAALTVILPASATEGDGTIAGTVRSSRAPLVPFTVFLGSSDTTELTVPASLVLAAGATQAVFTATVVNDTLIDGPRNATVTASVSGWTNGTDVVSVLDNESTNLTLTLPEMAMEGDGTLSGAGRVTLGGTLTTNLVVALSSSDTTELTVPASVTIPAGASTATFSPVVVNDALVDGMQAVKVSATPPGLGKDLASISIYDNESPPPAINPVPAHRASNVVVTTGLSWQLLGGGGGAAVSNEVYFGTVPTLGPTEFLGVTTNTSWALPRLAPATKYYWKVVTRRANSTPSPVWEFTTRGVHHFEWARVSSPQMALNPFTVAVAARDEFNTVVSNFTGTVALSGLIGSPAQQLFYDGFEDGNYSGWLSGGGAYTRFVTNNTSGGGTRSLTMIGGSLDHFDGLSCTLANATPETVNFYVRTSATNAAAAYVVLGQNTNIANTAAFFYARSDGTMGLYEDTVGPHTAPYVANQWYKVSLRFDWGAKRVDYYRDDELVEAGIPFRGAGTTNLSKISLYNYNNTQTWWDEIEVVSSNLVQRIRMAPTNSDSFVQGLWSGDLSVFTPATNMLLQAEDSEGNTGSSSRFNVISNTRPVLSIRDVATAEGDAGNHTANFTVTLLPAADTEVTVKFATHNGTASAGTDYRATNGTLTFTAGATSRTLPVLIYGDGGRGPDEAFTMELSDPVGAVISNAVGTCTIWNDDAPPNLYLSSRAGEPWHSSANLNAMNRVFGGNWEHEYFETANPARIFSSVYQFIFMDGSDSAANDLENFRSTNSSAIHAWVSAGGCLLLNAAPNEGNGLYLGFSVNLAYPAWCASAHAAWTAHPIFAGPFAPASATWTGNSFAHGAVSGGGVTPLLTNDTDGTIVLGERTYGSGFVVCGGLTTDNFHSPQPQGSNLTANIIAWAADPKPYVNIDDVLIVEGDAGTTNAVFRVTLNRAYGSNVSVGFNTSGTTATANVDYTVTAGTLVFAPGETVRQINVPIRGDLAVEGPETFRMVLLTVTNGLIQGNTGLCTIVDDDVPPNVYLRSTVGEPWGRMDSSNAMNTVFGGANWQGQFYETVNAAALFTPATRFVYMEGGDDNAVEMETFLTANRFLIDNWVWDGGFLFLNAAPTEGNGMDFGFGVDLVYSHSTRTAAVVSASHPIVTGPYTPVGTTWTGNAFGHGVVEGTGLIPLLLNTNGAAVLGEKAFGAGNVVMGGMTPYTFHLPLTQASNLFCNILSWAANPRPYVSVDDISVVEGDTGTTNAVFTVSLNRPHPSSVRVNYNTSANTATANLDYTVTSGSLIFTSGVASMQVSVPIRGDTVREGFEDFRLLLSGVTNAILQDSSGLCTIMDNDVPANVYLHSSVGDPWGATGYTNTMSRVFGTNWQLAFFEAADPAQLFSPVTRFIYMEGSANNAQEMETFLTANQSAIYDWVASGGHLYLNAAPTEGDGMFFGWGVNLVYDSPSSYTHTGAVATVTHPIVNGPFTPAGTTWTGGAFAHGSLTGNFTKLITNVLSGVTALAERTYGSGSVLFGGMTASKYHGPVTEASNLFGNILSWAADPKPYVTITDATGLEGDAGTVNFVFDVSLSRASTLPVTVNFATANISASSASDYYATNGVLTFAPGVTYGQVVVRVRGDTLGENSETFRVVLSTPTQAALWDAEGTGTIQNDDPFLATLPFTETWETAGFRPFWTVSGTGPSRALISTNQGAHGGAYHLLLDSATDGAYARNEVTLAMDLTGYTNLTLRFWAREFGEEPHGPPPTPFQFGTDFDGVAVSMDGIWWYEVQSLRTLAATNQEFAVNLDNVMATYGLAYTTPFFIRFNQYDNYGVATDGLAVDDISITGTLRRTIINPAGSIVVAESCAPFNGVVDPGERVTVSLALRNDGTSPSTNLVATLQANAGVVLPSGAQTFGALQPGATVSRNFSFTADGACGGLAYATLQLSDGSGGLGTATFPIRLGVAVPSGSATFANPAAITIVDNAAAAPYPSTIPVAGFTRPVTKVTVELRGLSHTFPDDLDVLLVGPTGLSAVLMSDVGGGADLTNVNLVFDDAAAFALADAGPTVAGTYRPSDIGLGDAFPVPAPALPHGANLSVFTGTNPNGDWKLFIQDDAGADTGSLASGWRLTLETGELRCCAPSVHLSPIFQTNHVIFSWPSVLGQNCIVQYADELGNPTTWNPLTTLVGDGSVIIFTQPVSNAPQRFFRLWLP
ncbi:MAG: hypothetical protein HZA90_03065 [Verrucomicrobia bacterium]|nr:hypothetical protein [Verrucomicrobiota bacterium]